MMEHFIYRDGKLQTGEEYTLVGRPINGSAEHVSGTVTKIGQDAAVVLPRFNVVGVFDGAGGTTDVGSPEEAALTAADAIDAYFTRGDDDMAGAMEYARAAVINNPAASICVGALLRIHHATVETVAAGDAGVLRYDTADHEIDILAEQQIAYREPANYLGRYLPRLSPPIPDVYAATERRLTGEQLYAMTDGVLGSRPDGDDIQGYHIQAARGDYQLLHDALRYDSDFSANIRRELLSERAKNLAARQVHDTETMHHVGHVLSPELIHADSFNEQQFDWDIWHEIVLPYIERLHPPRSPIGRRAIC